MTGKFDASPIEKILGTATYREETETEKPDAIMRELKLEDLLPFHTGDGHPFEVEEDDDMRELMADVSVNGILEPILVRTDKNFFGRYEIIAGHRRVYVARKQALATIKAIVMEYDDEMAIKLMVATNLKKRTHIKPSVKAKAYKMYMDANKRQGQRGDLTSSPVETKLRTDEKAAQEFNESRATIQRYIRLNELIPELLLRVDSDQIKFRAGVELSYLDKEAQSLLAAFIREHDVVPSLAQAELLKENQKNGGTVDESYLCIIFGIDNQDPVLKDMIEGNKKEQARVKAAKPKLNERFINDYLPEPIRKQSVEQKREYTQAALVMFNNYLLGHPEEKAKWEG
ncbi:ParB/RepB/Spo0J family partition protein [Emergencia sp. 1XD21-10]|uniref:ParB/RepB/Spo0J family partition protein n=1 Tax=Emergencia sp. 1XD21-10 TaxID=2304569 RepID=UPI00137AEB66|nr:ParB/RepB/Spo0J family partition protein [Emergencia sp. 1XD21-10]NCE98195.1 ParB/RepB/Spo0J family partition protein [Emergencia sp. 1XD21-10]